MTTYKWDAPAINNRSWRTTLRIRSHEEWLHNINNDPRREQRVARQECIVCFYTSRICGQGFTSFDCQMCGRQETHANTCTPDLCLTCAIENGLCQHCGADINLEQRTETVQSPVTDTEER